MKKIIKGEELQNKIDEAINMICDAVSTTLGPVGNNVIINSSIASSYITNDGVTIAMNIESEDPIINSILEIVKEATLKTNEIVGDGTTTTLVLLKELYFEGKKLIKEGISRIELKKEMFNSLEKVIELIKKESFKPTKEDLENVALVSGNDQVIANIVKEVFQKVKNARAIKLEESPNEQTYYELKKGYEFPISNLPEFLFVDKKKITLSNCQILLLDKINDFEEINKVLNDTLNSNQNLCLIASEIAENIKQNLLSLVMENNLPVYYLEIPVYESSKYQLLRDIEALINMDENNIGNALLLEIEEETATIFCKEKNIKIKNQINKIKKELKKCYNSYQQEELENRLAKLETGIATVYVGGITKVEKRERKMRFEDCIHAVETAKKGIVIGEGLAFWKVKENLEEKTKGDYIFKKALEKPFIKIMENANVNYKEIIFKIKDSSFTKIYDIKNNDFEEISKTKIIDPAYVLIEAIKNATSIASMLLTTNYLIINEFYENKKNIEI